MSKELENIQMVDLKNQYLRIKDDIDSAILSCIDSSQFIKGKKFEEFQLALAQYLRVEKVIACGNGTDALQIAMMALNLKKGDEVIVPAFTYIATAEVIGLLGLTPVVVDVDPHTFNISPKAVAEAITDKTKLIVPVHLFGQCADMNAILFIAQEYKIYVIEDTAQALGATYTFSDGSKKKAGCMGDIGCTSFFPSKNLGCFGDGGAMYSNNLDIAEKLRIIANHGQPKQYTHDVIGVNSRLDTLQAAILLEKLKYLDDYNHRRNIVADYYDNALSGIEGLDIPYRSTDSTHVFHQYTLKVKNAKRAALKAFLADNNIPSMIYYPKPLHHQKAYSDLVRQSGRLNTSEELCEQVLSLPIHTEMDETQLRFITDKVKEFFHG